MLGIFTDAEQKIWNTLCYMHITQERFKEYHTKQGQGSLFSIKTILKEMK